MTLKPGLVKKPKLGNLKFGRNPFSCGATGGTLEHILSTDNLSGKGGSSPKPGQCTIVDEFSTNYDIKDHVDLDRVKKALAKTESVKKIVAATSPQKMLELLGLHGLLLMADYNELDSANFVKGHLLPERLGGPGTNENLTPMCQSANSLWSAGFEKPVISELKMAQKVEEDSDFRILVRYVVQLKGSMKPWFSNPTPATKAMLSQLPAAIVGKATLAGFVAKGKSAKAISAAEVKRFPKFGMSLSLTL